jgi:hypothetical protein
MKHPAGFRPSYPRLIIRPNEEPEKLDVSPVDAIGSVLVYVDEVYDEVLTEPNPAQPEAEPQP